MNNDQLLSLLRTVLQIIGTVVVAHGTLGINGAIWEQISGALVVLAPTVWSMYANTKAAKLASVAAMSGPEKQQAFTGIPDSAKIEAVTALADVAQVIVKSSASDGVAAAAADSGQPKVVMTTPAVASAVQAAAKTS